MSTPSRLATTIPGAIALVLLLGQIDGGFLQADPITEKIERERKALEQLKKELEQEKKRVEETEKKRETVLESIEDLDHKMMSSRQQRYQVERELRRKDRELEDITNQLDQVRSRIRAGRSSIAARLRVQYMEGRFGYLKALFSADSPGELSRRFQYLSAISREEHNLLESYRQDVAKLTDVEARRTAARDRMVTLKRSTEEKLREIQGLKRQKRHFLARITRQKEAYEEAIAEREREAARVDSLLRELEERRKAAALRAPRPNPGFKGFKGRLPWPAIGKVVSFFGRQKHPNFDTYVQRKGIEIRTSEGTAIRAVMDGAVAYADWLKGYGLVLIVDHQNGFFSLYAHASKILTKVGVEVQAGQVIGETGDTGMTGENTLYFELRDGAEPVDPMLWLAKRPG